MGRPETVRQVGGNQLDNVGGGGVDTWFVLEHNIKYSLMCSQDSDSFISSGNRRCFCCSAHVWMSHDLDLEM